MLHLTMFILNLFPYYKHRVSSDFYTMSYLSILWWKYKNTDPNI